MLISKLAKDAQKGFTLIELMIVVAIIGILAAIAIPQFNAYRVKAFNTAAVTDSRNAGLAEEGLYADFQGYGGSAVAGAASTAAGIAATGSGNVVATTVVGEESALSLSNGVVLAALTDANFTTYTVTAKHQQGDRVVSIDNDVSGIFWDNSVAQGTAMVLGDATAATVGDDVTAAMNAM